MKHSKLNFPLCIILVTFSGVAFALDDTPENRSTQADRYLDAYGPNELFDHFAIDGPQDLSPDENREFVGWVLNFLDMKSLHAELKSVLIGEFTADELETLANLFELAPGKSSIEKHTLFTLALNGDSLNSELQNYVIKELNAEDLKSLASLSDTETLKAALEEYSPYLTRAIDLAKAESNRAENKAAKRMSLKWRSK